MKTIPRLSLRPVLAAALCAFLPGHTHAASLGTAFTYQGRLQTGSGPANGLYDFVVDLVDEFGSKKAGFAHNGVAVSNGLFTLLVDYSLYTPEPVFTGDASWLQIYVRTNGATDWDWVTMPVQPLPPVPNALFAAMAGQVAATNLIGSVPEDRLPTNVARLNADQVFTGSNRFTGPVVATSPASQFIGNGGGLTNVTPADGSVDHSKLASDLLSLNRVSDGSLGILRSGNGSVRFDVGDPSHSAPGVNSFMSFRGTSEAGTPRDWLVGGWGDFGRGFSISRQLGGGNEVLSLFIDADSGNVGINTDSPANTLQINPNFHAASGYGLVVSKADWGANIQINRAAGQTGLGLVVDNSAAGDASTSLLMVRNNASSGSPQFLLNVRADGNVGIGTNTPQAKLDVAGDIKATNVQVNSKSVAVGEEMLRIVRGVVSASGTNITGTGFTATRVGLGAFTVTFTTPFGGLPSVTATAVVPPPGTQADIIACMVMSNTVNYVTIGTRQAGTPLGSGLDRDFHFIAIGPR